MHKLPSKTKHAAGKMQHAGYSALTLCMLTIFGQWHCQTRNKSCSSAASMTARFDAKSRLGKTLYDSILPQTDGVRMLREVVTEVDVADIVSKWTGIPVSKLVASEREKLLHLNDVLHQRVVGQDEAVEAVADAIQRCAAFVMGCCDIRSPALAARHVGNVAASMFR